MYYESAESTDIEVVKVASLNGKRLKSEISGTNVVSRTYSEGDLTVPFSPNEVPQCRDNEDMDEETRSHLEHLGYL